MENNNLKSMKFLVAAVIFCIIFVAILPFVYNNFSPNKDRNNRNVNVVDVNKSAEEYDSAVKNEQTDLNEVKKTEEDSETKERIVDQDIANSEIVTTRSNLINKDIFEAATALKKEQKYESAVYEYQQIAKSTEDENIQARCYQEIALIYASIKRYGTALSFAQKAYNTSPSSDREMIMARLYYKTGNTDKATEHVNAILKRDFNE